LVVGFSVFLATSRNLLPAVVAQGAALLMSGDRTGGHRLIGPLTSCFHRRRNRRTREAVSGRASGYVTMQVPATTPPSSIPSTPKAANR
jgi:hypothetical protein